MRFDKVGKFLKVHLAGVASDKERVAVTYINRTAV
jgi:hypothetical protein